MAEQAQRRSASAALRVRTPPAPRRSAAAAPPASAATQILSARSRADARDTLRAALTCAVEEEIISRNSGCRRPAAQPPRTQAEAPRPGPSMKPAGSSNRPAATTRPCTPAYVLILVLGLRKGRSARAHLGAGRPRRRRALRRRAGPAGRRRAPPPRGQDRDIGSTAAAPRAVRRRAQAPPGSSRTPTVAAPAAPGSIPAWCSPPVTAPPIEPRNFNRSFDRCIVQGQGAQDHRARHPEDMRVTAGRARRAPARGDADPAAQQDRRHDGDLHRGSLGRHPRGAQEARPVARQTRPLLYFSCCTSIKNGQFPRSEPAADLGGRYWDRTSDLLGVNEALSR